MESPLDGGDLSRPSGRAVLLSGVADVMRRHLPPDDPMLPYADRLTSTPLGEQVLRGYLSGSIDLVSETMRWL